MMSFDKALNKIQITDIRANEIYLLRMFMKKINDVEFISNKS